MITAPLLSLFVIPAIYLLWRRGGLGQQPRPAPRAPAVSDAVAGVAPQAGS
jgi:hypothetical protein